MDEARVIRKDIIKLTCEFLETWFHQILYEYNLYPKSIFKLQRKFQVPVHIAMHPQVYDYISNFVRSCYPLLQKGDIKFISLIIKKEAIPVKKFVFEVNSALRNLDIPMDIVLESESIYALADLEQNLRACLIKVIGVGTASDDMKEEDPRDDVTFSLSIETIVDGYPESSGNGPVVAGAVDWIPLEPTYWKNIIPLKSVPMDLFKFNTFIAETAPNSSRKGKERCP